MKVLARNGFTLIELLIVVVIIGIIAAIAIPKFQTTKGKSYTASMRADLRNLAAAQEAFNYDHGYYSTDADSLTYSKSPGVTVSVVEASAKGWSAVSTHPSAWPMTCALYYGAASPIAPAPSEGVVGCR